MRKEQKAKVVTVAILLAALVVVLGQKNGWRLPQLPPRAVSKPDPTPQDAIYSMLDAARAGDVRGYMSSYTGQMRTSLQQALAESTEPGFAKYLKDSNAAIKGIAISEPQSLTDREVKVRVE